MLLTPRRMSRKQKNDVNDLRELTRTRADWKIGPGARFSKVPKLFG